MTDRLSIEKIQLHFERLSKIGNMGQQSEHGFFRAAWSDEESTAFNYFQEYGTSFGLHSRLDAIGNLILETPGNYTHYIETGSHLDTVYCGGNFDGAAGIIAGIEAIRTIFTSPQHHQKLTKGLRLRIWRGEESATYNIGCKGSEAAFGMLSPAALDYTYQGITLREAILRHGGDPSYIEHRIPAISQNEIDSIAAHLELHIEQGNCLEVSKVDIGIVTSIRAPSRANIYLRGEFDHSGATPMGIKFRKDVNLALAHIMVELDKLGKSKLDAGYDLVQTIGIINSDRNINTKFPEVYQNAIAKVSGFGYFSLDIRSDNSKFKTEYLSAAIHLTKSIAAQFGVSAEFEILSSAEPVEQMDTAIQQQIYIACKSLNISCMSMPSGAAHDVMKVGQQKNSLGIKIPIGMIFIPCQAGKSHCPEEFSSIEAVTKGANVLCATMNALAH